MRDVHALDGGGGIQSRKRASGDRSLGVALAGEHDGDGRGVRERGSREILEIAGCRGQQQRRQRVDEPGQHDLGLGVAEARVELDDLDALRREDQARIEQPDEGRALGIQATDDRLGHFARDEVDEGLLGIG